jgi:pimeloyl-ACP methyl ester carboxylesterase
MTTEDSYLPLDGGDIHVWQDGPRDAPPLMLIHGTGASGQEWDPLVPLLTGSHRVIRLDLLGCGQSAKPEDGDYSVPAQGRRVGLALDKLGVERAVLVGHSSGGYEAAALAEQRPDLVSAIAVINSGPGMAAYIAKEAPVDPTRWVSLTDDQLRQAVHTGFRPGFHIPDEYLAQVRAMTLHTFAAASQANFAYLREKTLPDRLAAVGKPLLVLFGEEDQRWSSTSAVDYSVVAGARVELLSGLGHSPNLEDPLRTAEHLLAFAALHV